MSEKTTPISDRSDQRASPWARSTLGENPAVFSEWIGPYPNEVSITGPSASPSGCPANNRAWTVKDETFDGVNCGMNRAGGCLACYCFFYSLAVEDPCQILVERKQLGPK